MKKIDRSLPDEIMKSGSVEGFIFNKIGETKKQYLYEVNQGGGVYYYELFNKKLDYKNMKWKYPEDEDFGYWAKCIGNKERALFLLNNPEKINWYLEK